MSDPLVLELHTVVTHSAWVLKTELGSSVTRASFLNHGAISPTSTSVILMTRHGEVMIPTLKALAHGTLTSKHAETDIS